MPYLWAWALWGAERVPPQQKPFKWQRAGAAVSPEGQLLFTQNTHYTLHPALGRHFLHSSK